MSYKTFEQYLENNYYDDIYNALHSFVDENRNHLNIHTHLVPEIEETEIDGFKVKSVRYQDAPGDNIKFDLTVITDIVIKGGGEEDTNQKWLTVSCTGILHDGLHDFAITNVDEYSQKAFVAENALSHFLVPYMYSDKLDDEATIFLQKYYPEALEQPVCINVEILLDRMGLQVEFPALSNRIFGQTIFAETDVYFERNTEEGTIGVTEKVPAGTILVNPNAFFMTNIGCVKNTFVHECIHWERHRKFFEMQRLLNDKLTSIQCEIDGKAVTQDNELEEALKWIEWQANALTPRILMPRDQAKILLEGYIADIRNKNPELRNAAVMEQALTDFADYYGVSKLSAKIRAIDLGFDEAEGCFVMLDGRAMPPYSFKRGSLEKGYTYTLDKRNEMVLFELNPALRDVAESKKFIYVNGMYCINAPKYIEQNEQGKNILTDYALEHVDECCLVFKRKMWNNKLFDDSLYSQCILCRDVDSSVVVEAVFDPDYENNQKAADREREVESIKKAYDDNRLIMSNLPESFGGTLSAHMDRKSMTNEELSGRSCVSETSISKYRNDTSERIELTTVLALCIGLNLQTDFCENLIEKAGYTLRVAVQAEFAFKYLIRNHTDGNIIEWNTILEELGVKEKIPKNYNPSKVLL